VTVMSAQEIIQRYHEAFGRGDVQGARSLLADDLHFKGPIEEFHNAGDYLASAVQLVHREPEERWTIDRLASAVGYSRSTFAARFRELGGEAPMAYARGRDSSERRRCSSGRI
jgi:AraC-like DNA-binding protein